MQITQFDEVKRCAHCGKIVTTGADVHPDCQKQYEQYWDEREKELEYRAASGNDPRVRSHDVWGL